MSNTTCDKGQIIPSTTKDNHHVNHSKNDISKIGKNLDYHVKLHIPTT